MQKFKNKTLQKFYSLSPKTGSFQKNLNINNIYNIANFSQFNPLIEYGNKNNISSNIFLYYSPKHININNAQIRNIYSPKRKNLSLKKSSSQKDIINNRPLSHRPQNNNSFYSFSLTNRSPIYTKKKSNYNLEKEKLYQETYQIRKIVNFLNKKLSKIRQENSRKDDQIKKRQEKINDIIINSDNESTFNENKKNETIINKRNSNLNLDKLHKFNLSENSSLNDLSINSSMNYFNSNNKKEEEIPIYSNFNINPNKNSGAYNLLKKIKKSIEQMNNFILIEKKKYDAIKKSLFLTKLNELNIETSLLEEQINKINAFKQKGILIQEENQKKKENNYKLKLNIERQEQIIKSLNKRSNNLDNEEAKLRYILSEIKKNLEKKEKKININKAKLNSLIKKNNLLSKNKDLNEKKEQLNNINNSNIYDTNSPILIKSYYASEISKLNKIIKFYTMQCDFSEKEIAKLKNQQIKIEEASNKDKKNNKKDESIKLVISNFQNDKIKKSFDLADNEKINNIKKVLNETNEENNKLKKKLDIYKKKLFELEKNNKENNDEDFYNKSQIEFGIDENNPFYTDENDNNPIKTGKYTSTQFNQFTHILFKNFESREISFDESKEKLIKLFLDFNQKNNIINIPNEEMNYKSKQFNLITEGYSKIILDVLNRNNQYNFITTKIFMKALFYNSEYDINKLLEYFKILFSYTRNHSSEEEKYLIKLKTKYKTLIEKLISCVKEYLSTSKIKNKKYIDLLQLKTLLEINKINFKDEYIEFIFYYMKKFEDPESKLSDLKLSILYNLLDYSEYNDENSEINTNVKEENNYNNDINIDINKNDKKINNINSLKKEANKQIKENIEQNIDNIESNQENKNKLKSDDDNKLEKLSQELSESLPQEKRSITDKNNLNQKVNNISLEFQNRQNNNEKANEKNIDDTDEESMTEITNEEYVKQLVGAIKQMKEGLEKSNTNFNDLMNNIIQKRKINGIFYEYVTIEDFNDQLKTIKINLSDLKLSCLCSKYSIPNELRLIDTNRINKDIQRYIKGQLKYEEEE